MCEKFKIFLHKNEKLFQADFLIYLFFNKTSKKKYNLNIVLSYLTSQPPHPQLPTKKGAWIWGGGFYTLRISPDPPSCTIN